MVDTEWFARGRCTLCYSSVVAVALAEQRTLQVPQDAVVLRVIAVS